jgi:hypothetical protein
MSDIVWYVKHIPQVTLREAFIDENNDQFQVPSNLILSKSKPSLYLVGYPILFPAF